MNFSEVSNVRKTSINIIQNFCEEMKGSQTKYLPTYGE